MGQSVLTATLGGTAVGAVVGLELATSEWMRIDTEPRTKRKHQNHNQKHKPKEDRDGRKRISMEPLNDRSENHQSHVPNDVGPQVGNDTSGNESEDGKEQTHQGPEEHEQGRRLEGN